MSTTSLRLDADITLHARRLRSLIFFQMLPATLLSPAIRPLFARYHAGDESAMHAFMAVNMFAAALLVPWLAARAERVQDIRRPLALTIAADSVLLAALALPVPTWVLLSMRAIEGVAHVGVTSLLLAEMSRIAAGTRRAELMGQAGAALMLAVALGSTLGGLCVAVDPRLAFWIGSGIQAGVAIILVRSGDVIRPEARVESEARVRFAEVRALIVPLLAVFVGRFTIGCLIVTFPLFAHRVHGISDRAIGMLFTLITLPFALAMYPAARFSEKIPRSRVMTCGAFSHALALLALGRVPAAWLPVEMIVLGVASALLFAPTLCYAGARGETRHKHRMAVLNAAGCLGMVIGPMVAGVTCSLAGRSDPAAGYEAVFVLAACAVLLWLLTSVPWLLLQGRLEQQALRQSTSAE